jgi:RNA polymerase sigma-70 factor (ECF subfamily)
MAAMSTFAAPRPGPRPLDPERLASHMERLTRVARHLTGRHGDAEDLVQDTFERVLRRPRTVSGSEAAYLVQAVRNTHLSRLRSAASRVRTVALPEDFEPVDVGAEDRPMSARRAREVLDAVAALPKGFREAVVLCDVHGYRAGEAARVLGIAEGTLHSRLHRGRAQVARACEA